MMINLQSYDKHYDDLLLRQVLRRFTLQQVVHIILCPFNPETCLDRSTELFEQPNDQEQGSTFMKKMHEVTGTERRRDDTAKYTNVN
ncbi:unnamed protein product [Bursaphelenchus okinawaensis]|uniref:Uncharacterized protein n=1 Tax=Bursaphelenchus okinawaensis TaxID=465554 RepID=A0A811KFE4_9BILA|nr:unnamed protein product [Bursaphelenchus okinawaensis]CAG9102326.1 unnamed protein product [Bursaphelenchus okinawaensis]